MHAIEIAAQAPQPLQLFLPYYLFDYLFLFVGSETLLKGIELSDHQYLGVKLAVRYGNQLKLIQSTAESSLVLLLKKIKCFLQGQQHKPAESKLSILTRFLLLTSFKFVIFIIIVITIIIFIFFNRVLDSSPPRGQRFNYWELSVIR